MRPSTRSHLAIFPELADAAADAARADVRVLLTGESGVGKQTLARLIHERSRGPAAPLVVVDCDEVSDSQFESEMLDASIGGNPDAASSERWLAQARGGTIVLRSVEKMTDRKQSALFRHLDLHYGGQRGQHSAPPDVRLIAVGCSSFLRTVETGHFRSDLFYRLNTIHLAVKPLRERRDDLPDLFDRFIHDAAGALGRTASTISTDAMRKITAYSWPGNLRELRMVAEDLVRKPTEVIDSKILPARFLTETAGSARPTNLRLFNPGQPRDDAQLL